MSSYDKHSTSGRRFSVRRNDCRAGGSQRSSRVSDSSRDYARESLQSPRRQRWKLWADADPARHGTSYGLSRLSRGPARSSNQFDVCGSILGRCLSCRSWQRKPRCGAICTRVLWGGEEARFLAIRFFSIIRNTYWLPVAAVHESAIGTKRTSQRCRAMSAFGGKADITRMRIRCPLLIHGGNRSARFVVVHNVASSTMRVHGYLLKMYITYSARRRAARQ